MRHVLQVLQINRHSCQADKNNYCLIIGTENGPLRPLFVMLRLVRTPARHVTKQVKFFDYLQRQNAIQQTALSFHGSRRRALSHWRSNGKICSSVFCSSATYRELSSSAAIDNPPVSTLSQDVRYPAALASEVNRLERIRNVGILAHVDAGKTTVTERMLALAGVVPRAGSVDTGNTVTDFLPAERERGITIQSAAISFEWRSSSSPRNGGDENNKDLDAVTVHLIDTPGHVDFSVEVNRSVAVLDGAVLVVDAVAGVQAQTETVWRALRRPWVQSLFTNNHLTEEGAETGQGDSVSPSASPSVSDAYEHEPLPCLALVNKMDKDGSHFSKAIESLRAKLPGANPIAIQIPLVWSSSNHSTPPPKQGEHIDFSDIVAVPSKANSSYSGGGSFLGVVDLVHLRTVIWPDVPMSNVGNIERCSPIVSNLFERNESGERVAKQGLAHIAKVALEARHDLVASLADVDETIEDFFLMEEDPSIADVQQALRRATLQRKVLPVMASAALKGKGVEPVLDAVAEYLPNPLDRMPPALLQLGTATSDRKGKGKEKKQKKRVASSKTMEELADIPNMRLGHPLHPSLLAMAFKVIHMKGRGSGDGRVVFARVYSGKLEARDTVKCITPIMSGAATVNYNNSTESSTDGSSSVAAADRSKPRKERIGAMLELSGGKFDNIANGICRSGDVCALVGLRTVVTGDTIMLASSGGGKKGKNNNAPTEENVCLAGVAAPRPVLTVRLEVENSDEEKKLTHALACLTVEDPSLLVEETESATLLSGLGELHIEVTVDRLMREYGIEVSTGIPLVAYRETVKGTIETDGLYHYDRTIGGTRLQGSVHIKIEPLERKNNSPILNLVDPVVTIGEQARLFLDIEEDDEDFVDNNIVAKALIAGVQGALRRGTIGPYPMGNIKCTILDVDANGGFSALQSLPGSIRAAAANGVSTLLFNSQSMCSVIEPTMSVEVTAPGEMLGTVLSDLNTRRGLIGDIVSSDEGNARSLIRADVPLSEILGYANSLRSITGGEAAFTAEYKGYVQCDSPNVNY
jgi:elongation factor G